MIEDQQQSKKQTFKFQSSYSDFMRLSQTDKELLDHYQEFMSTLEEANDINHEGRRGDLSDAEVVKKL